MSLKSEMKSQRRQGVKDEQEESEEEEEPNIGMTPNEEQIQLKKRIYRCREEYYQQKKDFLKVKQKTVQEIEDENKEFEKLLKNRSLKIKKYYKGLGKERESDEIDKFLRKYILTKD
ncbi:unnamed protein product (macronuclear) [Paramecium tetraurelia]|uniref:Uncharacterized protein n=1 Tax=Paramecium tetraurelia TaxID=5888 RepID=A0BJ60_PARTE|nr:uncharacterized protein GSPATT00004950001 [Paramecium tetraurelia]CAK58577.1 unnamed protein product [Paramecium tetraurelia]|eukprot:XP_001425975.1 hypothetical protein (macronuclear) [Paramecium tetraurelia strain d4-2]